jgi:hypothetical protein
MNTDNADKSLRSIELRGSDFTELCGKISPTSRKGKELVHRIVLIGVPSGLHFVLDPKA